MSIETRLLGEAVSYGKELEARLDNVKQELRRLSAENRDLRRRLRDVGAVVGNGEEKAHHGLHGPLGPQAMCEQSPSGPDEELGDYDRKRD